MGVGEVQVGRGRHIEGVIGRGHRVQRVRKRVLGTEEIRLKIQRVVWKLVSGSWIFHCFVWFREGEEWFMTACRDARETKRKKHVQREYVS